MQEMLSGIFDLMGLATGLLFGWIASRRALVTGNFGGAMATMVSGIAPRSGLGFAELDELPKRVILGLSAATTGPYACSLRAERNTYRTLHEQASAKARRLPKYERSAARP